MNLAVKRLPNGIGGLVKMANEVLEKMASKAMWFTLAVVAALALAPQTARAESGSVIVTGGGEVKYTDAAKVEKITNPDGTEEFLLYYTYENSPTGSFELPGTTSARILAIGGGGGGGATYRGATSGSTYGGGAGGGAGGFFHTNGIFSAAVYSVIVGKGGDAAALGTSRTIVDYSGKDGEATKIVVGDDETLLLVAPGGGGGGGETAGHDGGSGGGGSMYRKSASESVSNKGGSGIDGLGNKGGGGNAGNYGGGGGGAGGVGADASTKNPVGGAGKQSDITLPANTPQNQWPWYAGGGGGGCNDRNITSGSSGIAGGSGVGGTGGVGNKAFDATSGKANTGSGGGGSSYNVIGGNGGSGIVIVRIAGAISGGLERPKDLVYKYDGKEKKSYQTSPFYTVTGDNVGTNAGVYVCTVTLKDGFEWVGGGKEPVKVAMTIYDGQYSGTVDVTGAPISFQGAAETNWVKNAKGGYDFLLKFTGAGTYTLPGTTKARILAIGGGGGGGATYRGATSGSTYGGGGGGGAGALVETNDMYSAGVFCVNVGVGGAAAALGTSRTVVDYSGQDGGRTFILNNSTVCVNAPGGGGGGGETAGHDGGSGGGGSMYRKSASESVSNKGGSGIDGLGNKGGGGNAGNYGGGGGGAGGVGADASTKNPVGGKGRQSDITVNFGVVQENWPWYAGGGGGGCNDRNITSGSSGIAGGSGVGGTGGVGNKAFDATPGKANTGSGGGGSSYNVIGGNGGSGVVYVRISAAMEGELVKPEKTIEITYDGNAHTTRVSNVFYDVSGDNIATNARDMPYKSTVALKDGYTWPGGDPESPIDIEMTIKKCPVTISGLKMDSWSYIKDTSKMPDPQYTVTPAWVKPIVEYATSKEAPDADWGKTKPAVVGDYWVRVRIPDTENFSGETAFANFKISKAKVTFTDFFQKDWMAGTPDEATPKPRCTVDPSWVFPDCVRYDYGTPESDPLKDEDWKPAKPQELGTWAIRIRAENDENYDYVPATATFNVVKGLGNIFTDYVEFEIPALEDGRELTNFPYKVVLHESDDAPLAGFLYERAGADGKEMGATDLFGNVTPYTVVDWNTHGDSVVYVKVPLIASSNQTLRLYWHLRSGATAPGDNPKGTWSDWTKADAEKTDVPAATFDLVVKDGFRVDYWTKKPALSKSVWAVKGEPGVLTEGVLADGTYTTTLINTVTGAPVTFPPTQGGSYRFVFTLDNPNMEYEDLSYHVDFAVTDSLPMDRLQGGAPSLTASGRVFLANDDDAPGHEVSNQSYWHEDPAEAYFWEHTGAHKAMSDFPNLRKYPGNVHRLNYVDETGMTNVLWRFENVIFGNTFNKTTLEGAHCFLPWSSTGLGMSSATPKPGTRDESGWIVLQNNTNARVYSPCYTNGIGTIYFDAVNAYTVLSGTEQDNFGIEIDFATNVWVDVLDHSSRSLPPTDANCYGKNEYGVETEFGRLTEACWHPATMLPLKRDNNASAFTPQEKTDHLVLNISKGGSTNNFFRVCVNLDYRGPVRFRIRRATVKTGTDDVYGSYIALDNIIVSCPKSMAALRPLGVYDDTKGGKRVIGQEGAMSVPYPSLTDHTVYGAATNSAWISEVADVPPESLVLLSRLHYRWRYGDQAVGEWKSVDLSPFDQFRSTVPMDLTYEDGDVEFFYESFMRVPFYRYYDYSGANVGLGGLYTEETGTLTNTFADVAGEYARYTGPVSSTNWFFRLRAGQSDWDEIHVSLNGAHNDDVAMELISDHRWRGLVKVPTNDVGDVTFAFNGIYRRAKWGAGLVESDKWWYPTANIEKLPGRGETQVGKATGFGFRVDGATNYFEFEFDDETGAFTVCHAEYQAFNAWHDAHREDGSFVGNYTEPSGVSDTTMVTTNAHMNTWTLPKLSDENWNESFVMLNYTDPLYPKYTADYLTTAKMPHQWSGKNGIFVDAELTNSNANDKAKSSGIAWQMQGNGKGSVSFTQTDTPSGIDTIKFKARLAQLTKLGDFSAWKGGFAEHDYTFVFPALMSAANGNDCSPGAAMSIVGYYDPWEGCYEFRIERTDKEGLLFSIYKWAPFENEMVSTCLASHWFRSAVFMNNANNASPNMYAMFISVGTDKDDSGTTIMAGLSINAKAPNDSYSGSSATYRAIGCIDRDNPLTQGSFGAISANCTGLFMSPRHYEAILPKATVSASWKDIVAGQSWYVDSAPVTYTGTYHDDRDIIDPETTTGRHQWGFTTGRAAYKQLDYDSGRYTAKGLCPPADMKQTIGVYLKPANGKDDWKLYEERTVNKYAFADYSLTLRTNENCHVMLQTGSKAADVTVWKIEQTAWNGEDIANLDGTSRDFVYTQAFIEQEVLNKVTNRYARLQPSRANPEDALSLRSPLLSGLGMVGFSYKNADPNAEIWVQVATNVVASTLSGSTGYNHLTNSVDYGETASGRAWVTVKKYTAADLGSSGSKVYYLGWHYDVADPQQGVIRLFVPPSQVRAAQGQVMTKPTWGSITVTDFFVHDEPPIDSHSWLGWNIRTVGDAKDSERRMYLPDMSVDDAVGTGLSVGLNNSYAKDIEPGHDQSEYWNNNPYVQSPTMGTGVGTTAKATIGKIRFRARLYDTNASPAKVSVYAVKDGTATDWGDPLKTFEITSPRYKAFEYQAPSEAYYAAMRLVVEGVKKGEERAGVNRVLLDEVVVSEKNDVAVGFLYARPFRSGLGSDFVIEDILAREQQPLVGESWGVQAKLKFDTFDNAIDLERGFRVTFSYYAGAEPWGYENWKDLAEVKDVELKQVGAKEDYVFRSSAYDRATVVMPLSVPDSVVQYSLRVYYYEKGNDVELSRSIAVTDQEGEGWTNPDWYLPVDRNREGDEVAGEWKQQTSPYTIIDSVSPGRAWINEVNFNDGTKADNGGRAIPETNQFIEIAVPWGVDMTGWSVRLTDMNCRQIQLAKLGSDGIPSVKKSAQRSGDYDFFVLQSPKTKDNGGIRDPGRPGVQVADGTWAQVTLPSTLNKGTMQYDEPYQLELVRPNGIIEHQFVLGGTNEWRRYGPAPEYDGTNLVALLNDVDFAAGIPIRRYYAGDDNARTSAGPDVFASFGIRGGSHGEAGGWSADMGFTPGRLNESQDPLENWYIHPSGESCWLYARLLGEHLSQRIGDDTSPDTFVVLNSGQSTNIEYTVANWYQVEKVFRIENGVTNELPVGMEGTFTYTVNNVTGITTIVAVEGLSKRLVDAGLDPADRYTPAIMRWLENGVANGRPFAHPDGEIRNATFRGLWSGATNVALGVKAMYVLDLDPTEGGWWLRGGTTYVDVDVKRTWHHADTGRDEIFKDVQIRAKLYLSNDVERAGVTRPEAYAPPRLQGPNGERSDDPASYTSWTGMSFKVVGQLRNDEPHVSKEFLPLRWFVFGSDSFSGKGGENEFSSLIEIYDPFSRLSPGYTYDWYMYPGSPVWYQWRINEEMIGAGIEMLHEDSTYEGKPPFNN